jgi:hypothetical protein
LIRVRNYLQSRSNVAPTKLEVNKAQNLQELATSRYKLVRDSNLDIDETQMELYKLVQVKLIFAFLSTHYKRRQIIKLLNVMNKTQKL